MTNPFAKGSTATTPATPADSAPATEDAKNLGIGDPFGSPSGGGDGERIVDYVDRLLLIKPTEVVAEMMTAQGKAENVVRVDMAVLDDPTDPGKIVEGVLLFQQALKREARKIYDSPLPYLLGRLNKGKTNSNNTLYTFQEATPEEADLARQFIAARANNPL
jgi:hypothetical protein